MNDTPHDPPRPVPNLASALRVARAEDAERCEVIADLRSLALARLGLLRDALAPVLAQLPDDVDLFDVGLMPGDPPRLFIDMIAFVETSRDRRGYRFLQDRRHGRVILAETDTLDATVEAITAYIARRMVERDKALAADEPALLHVERPAALASETPHAPDPSPPDASVDRRHWVSQSFWFVIEVLGLLALLTLLFFGLRWGTLAWNALPPLHR